MSTLILPRPSTQPDLYFGKYVASLFANGEQGAWYDPSDMSTLYQDSAGTVPVTAVEQIVGRILDKSGRGNHATQTTTASRPVLSARVNLLTNTEAFDSASWRKLNGGTQPDSLVLPNVEIAPNNTLTADKLVEPLSVSPAESNARIYVFNVPTTSGISHTFTIHAKAAERKYISIRLESSGNNFGVLVDLENGNTFTGRFDGTLASSPLSNLIVSNVGNGWWRISGTYTAGASTVVLIHACATNTTTSYTGDGTSGIYIWGADLRVANKSTTLPPYQRVNTATDYDTQGFPLYLRFDGVDDSLVTPSINFTATDKMTVFAGVRKLRDSAVGIFLELSANLNTNAGSFSITIPNGANTKFAAALSNGDSKTYNSADYTDSAAPLTTVNTVLFDKALTSAEVTAIRKNGADQSLTRAPNGDTTGNFGNYPLFIGRRSGTQFPFNGRLYGLIVRGAETDNLHLTNVERFLAHKSGVLL